jgi:hypothetical protein
MQLTCTPIDATMFADPHVGAVVHRMTTAQCRTMMELVAGLKAHELNQESKWACIIILSGVAMLALMYLRRPIRYTRTVTPQNTP